MFGNKKSSARSGRLSAYDYALLCSVKQAARRVPGYLSGAPGLVVFVVPKGRPLRHYIEAVRAVVHHREGRTDVANSGFIYIDQGSKPAGFRDEFESDCRDKRRGAVLIYSNDAIPTYVRLAADAIVEISPISARHFRAACEYVLRISVTQKQAVEALTYPEELLWNALRIGRPIEDSLRRLRETPVAEATDERVAEPNAAPPLEQLSGYGEAKEWGLQLAVDLAHWKDGRLFWSDVDRGLLLSGPPGVGKTQFARSLAVSCGCHFVGTSVAQWQAKGHLGDMLKAMRADFAAAKNNAPSIIMLDELDSVGDRQSFASDHANYSTQVVNCLLECLDGIGGREGVIVIGATNNPEKIDAAVRRPGRLDRHISIGMPTARDCAEILAHHLAGRFDLKELMPLGEHMEGMTGADIEQLARDCRRVARKERREVGMNDITARLPKAVLIEGHFRKTVCVHEAGHAIVANHLQVGQLMGIVVQRQVNLKAPSQHAGLAVINQKIVEFRDRQRYLNEICMYLAGMAAETVIFGCHGDGAGTGDQSDLARATRLAILVEASFGMGSQVRYRGSSETVGPDQLEVDVELRGCVDAILDEQFQRAKSLLMQRRRLLSAVSDELEEIGKMDLKRFATLESSLTPETASLVPRQRK